MGGGYYFVVKKQLFARFSCTKKPHLNPLYATPNSCRTRIDYMPPDIPILSVFAYLALLYAKLMTELPWAFALCIHGSQVIVSVQTSNQETHKILRHHWPFGL